MQLVVDEIIFLKRLSFYLRICCPKNDTTIIRVMHLQFYLPSYLGPNTESAFFCVSSCFLPARQPHAVEVSHCPFYC